MANLRNTMGAPAAAHSGETVEEVRDRWSGEISTGEMPMTQDWNMPWTPEDTRFGGPAVAGQMTGSFNGMQMGQMNGMPMQVRPGGLQMSENGSMAQSGGLNMNNRLPSEVIESPTTVNEAYLGSLKAMLHRNKGNFIVATFLVGTQNTVSWEGILYEVGNDYITIYQPGRDRYIVTDMYSLKYMEFYDTQRRELCDQMLRSNGWQNGSW